jgi:hypothetical protein
MSGTDIPGSGSRWGPADGATGTVLEAEPPTVSGSAEAVGGRPDLARDGTGPGRSAPGDPGADDGSA